MLRRGRLRLYHVSSRSQYRSSGSHLHCHLCWKERKYSNNVSATACRDFPSGVTGVLLSRLAIQGLVVRGLVDVFSPGVNIGSGEFHCERTDHAELRSPAATCLCRLLWPPQVRGGGGGADGDGFAR